MQKRNSDTALCGTLIAMVPCQEGLVVAADSRTRVLGVDYDIRDKLIRPIRPPHTIATVTGTGEFIPGFPLGVINQEAHIQNAPRLMDISEAVRQHLEANGPVNDDAAMVALGRSCLAEIDRYVCGRRGDNGNLAQHAGSELCSVVVATHDPNTEISTIRRLTVDISADIEPSISISDTVTCQPNCTGTIYAFGETDYFEQIVNVLGRKFLTEALRFKQQQNQIQDITVVDAQTVAENVIEATEAMSAIVPAPSGIGGPVHCYLLGQDPAPIKL